MAAHVRTECAGCGGQLQVVLDLGSSPLADQFCARPEAEGPAYRLRMAACRACGLAQLLEVVDDHELFGSDYGFRTGGSPALVNYYRHWASWALGQSGGVKSVLDIGCNDGTLARFFQEAGCRVTGVDPSGAAAEAAGRGTEVYNEAFTAVSAAELLDDIGPVDLVTGINVAAHVQDPVGFLRGIGIMLAKDGLAILEFQDLERLVAGGQFDHVYHEHRFFYSVQSFATLAHRAGLHMAGFTRTEGQGGSIRAVLCAGTGTWQYVSPLATVEALSLLQPRAEMVRSQLHWQLMEAAERGRAAGYGATAKSATLLNFCKIDSSVLDYVEDATPSKAGKLTPGTHIPIVMAGERERPATFLVLAWNYLGAIIRREADFLENGGRFIVPLPVPYTI